MWSWGLQSSDASGRRHRTVEQTGGAAHRCLTARGRHKQRTVIQQIVQCLFPIRIMPTCVVRPCVSLRSRPTRYDPSRRASHRQTIRFTSNEVLLLFPDCMHIGRVFLASRKSYTAVRTPRDRTVRRRRWLQSIISSGSTPSSQLSGRNRTNVSD
jgi:hypothetical protein